MSRKFLDSLRVKNTKRCKMLFPNIRKEPLIYWTNAIAGEVGELCNITKKIVRGDKDVHYVRKDIEKELADIVIYIDLFCGILNLDIEKIVKEKFNEKSKLWNSSILFKEVR